MAHASFQPDWRGHLGWNFDAQRTLRSALYLCNVRNGTVVYADGHRLVRPSQKTSGCPPTLSVYWLSLAARYLCAYRRGLDIEHDTDPAHGVIGRNTDCAGGCARVYLLAAEQARRDNLKTRRRKTSERTVGRFYSEHKCGQPFNTPPDGAAGIVVAVKQVLSQRSCSLFSSELAQNTFKRQNLQRALL
jgi:hypothetical protein